MTAALQGGMAPGWVEIIPWLLEDKYGVLRPVSQCAIPDQISGLCLVLITQPGWSTYTKSNHSRQ